LEKEAGEEVAQIIPCPAVIRSRESGPELARDQETKILRASGLQNDI
jgi:hypothetical protein